MRRDDEPQLVQQANRINDFYAPDRSEEWWYIYQVIENVRDLESQK